MESVTWDEIQKGFWVTALLFTIMIGCVMLFFFVSQKEFKGYYLRNSDSDSHKYCIYEEWDNWWDTEAYCTTNPIEAMQVYKYLKDEEVTERNGEYILEHHTGGE